MCLLLPHIEVLNINGNLFDRIAEPSLRFCENMAHLSIAYNNFGGTLLSELGLLPKLKELDVSGNSMMGGIIPTEYGQLPNLALLGLEGTGIVGQVPESLCAHVVQQFSEIHANYSITECGE